MAVINLDFDLTEYLPMWNYMVELQPADNQLVWIRMLYVDAPVQATWHAGLDDFEVTGFTVHVPWYFVTRWKAV